MRKNKIGLVFVMGIAGIALASCNGRNTSSIDEKKDNSIERFVVGAVASIEKAVYGEYNYDMLASGVSEIPMVYQDSEGSYHDLLVTYQTKDSLAWTYTVQDGMKWSDGEPVTAEDILFTLQYEDKEGSANLVDQTDSEGKTTSRKYTSYQISEDKRSITLTLAKANVRELSNMAAFRVAPKHALDKENPTEEDYRVTAGPYVLDSFDKKNGTLKYKKNPYYPEKVNVEEIIYQLYANDDVMYTALASGEIDMTWGYNASVSASYFDVLEQSGTVTLTSAPQKNAPAVLVFNNKEGYIFHDENLRIAISYALNYESFKSVFGTKYASVPNRGFVPSSTFGYKETEKLSTDLDKAKEYLAKSGYLEKNKDGFYEKDGKVLEFSLTVNSQAKTPHTRYAELVKTNLEAFGIKVNLDTLTSSEYQAKTSNKFSNSNITMEAAIMSYTANGMGMMGGLGTIYVDANHAVQGGAQVSDKEFSDAVEELNGATTIEAYIAAAAKVQEYYAKHTPLIALFSDSVSYAYSKKFRGLSIDAGFGLNSIPNWSTIEKN